MQINFYFFTSSIFLRRKRQANTAIVLLIFLSFENTNFLVIVSNLLEIDIYISPTGFSSLPPPGPDIPVVDIP